MEKKQKRGVSPVIAVVLLVLITFMAAGIVWTFVKSMVEGGLKEGNCFDLRDHAKVVESDYTCYDDAETKIMIERNFKEAEIKGFRIGLAFEGSSTPYNLIDGEEVSGVKMLDNNETIRIPKSGGAETYVFEKAGKQAELGIITKDSQICDMGSFKIPEC